MNAKCSNCLAGQCLLHPTNYMPMRDRTTRSVKFCDGMNAKCRDYEPSKAKP